MFSEAKVGVVRLFLFSQFRQHSRRALHPRRERSWRRGEGVMCFLLLCRSRCIFSL